MSNKRTLSFALIWLASIILGVIYNSMWVDVINSYLSSYITVILTLFFIGTGILVFVRATEINLDSKRLYVLLYTFCAVFISSLLWNEKQHFYYLADTLLDGTLIMMLFPLGLLCIKNSFNSKYGIIISSLSFLGILASAAIISGTKLFMIAGAFLFVGETLAIKLYKPEKKKIWSWHSCIMFVIYMGMTLLLISCSVNYEQRVIGFIEPQRISEYKNLLDWITSSNWFDYFPNSTFLNDINSPYAATYAHLLTILGRIPCIAIILAQGYAIVCMLLNTLCFKDKNRKYLGLMSCVMLAFHLIYSVASSFIRIPMTELGAPFITIYGMGYCLPPLFLYICLELAERGVMLNVSFRLREIIGFAPDENEKIDEKYESLYEDFSNNVNEETFTENKIFVISGPSGSGKTTLFKAIQKKYPYIIKTISDTTRDIRDDEENGIDYNFIHKGVFERNIKSGHYVEYNIYDNNYYGTSHEEIRKARQAPATAMIIDVNGAENVKKHYPDAVTIFIAPPSIDVLIERIKTRNANTPEELENRIETAKQELEKVENFDCVITNDEFDTAVSELESIINNHLTAIDLK